MIDKRLLGTWRSDARKTMREIRNRRDIAEKHHKKIRSMFGKLCVRYTRARVYREYGGDKSADPYRVVAKDSDSVAIVGPSVFGDGEEIYHIHFEADHYWICLGKFREYFKRVE